MRKTPNAVNTRENGKEEFYTLVVPPMGVKFGTEEGTFLRAKFHPHRCNVSPLRGGKPQNRPLNKLNTGGLRCAQCCR